MEPWSTTILPLGARSPLKYVLETRSPKSLRVPPYSRKKRVWEEEKRRKGENSIDGKAIMKEERGNERKKGRKEEGDEEERKQNRRKGNNEGEGEMKGKSEGKK